jgi:hypothetical protein
MNLKILSTGSLVFFVVFTIGNVLAQERTWNVYENATLGFKIVILLTGYMSKQMNNLTGYPGLVVSYLHLRQR